MMKFEQLWTLHVRRLTCANMGILLISFIIVFQHIRQQLRSIL